MPESADLLFELGTEELPPTALARLAAALRDHFVAGLDKQRLRHGEAHFLATPRRLAVVVEQLALRQPDSRIERRGPAVKAAFDADGHPTKAALGFAASCGVEVEQLQRVSTPKGEWLVFSRPEPGKAASELLPGIAEQALTSLPIPKRMRWGASRAEFVRPVHWLLFLHGEAVVPCTLLDTEAGDCTHGHRFHHPDAIRITSPREYLEQLETRGKVLADFDKRRKRIRCQVVEIARELGGEAVIDEGLLDEVTALVEWPQAIGGSFDRGFLEVPHEALILTMKKNQKYFHLVDKKGALLPHFITVANVESRDPAVIAAGNERVIRPRLADARFFWEQDGKTTLAALRDGLKQVLFQQRLGSLYEKTERIAALARHIATEIDGDPALATRAGELCKSDLMTEMVYEFPEMQGYMGRYQALRDGEPEELAEAMNEVYLPRHSGDRLPRTRTGLALALADRLDTLIGIFAIDQKPSGTKDPFGLRRAALGVLRILIETPLSLDLRELLTTAAGAYPDGLANDDCVETVFTYALERLTAYYQDRGIRGDVTDSVLSLRPSVPADTDRRIRAVQDFIQLPEAASLASANKRISNILKKAGDTIPDRVDPERLVEPAEQALYRKLVERESAVGALFDAGRYEEGLSRLAALREPVDAFFDDVMVMSEDPGLRANRFALLKRLAALFLRVADISRLQLERTA